MTLAELLNKEALDFIENCDDTTFRNLLSNVILARKHGVDKRIDSRGMVVPRRSTNSTTSPNSTNWTKWSMVERSEDFPDPRR